MKKFSRKGAVKLVKVHGRHLLVYSRSTGVRRVKAGMRGWESLVSEEEKQRSEQSRKGVVRNVSRVSCTGLVFGPTRGPNTPGQVGGNAWSIALRIHPFQSPPTSWRGGGGKRRKVGQGRLRPCIAGAAVGAAVAGASHGRQ